MSSVSKGGAVSSVSESGAAGTGHLGDPARLAALQRSGLLDSPTEESFDRVVRVAQRLLGVPVALVSVLDDRRQFYKSAVGLTGPEAEARGTGLDASFCQYVVLDDGPLVVNDARITPLVSDNPAIESQGVIAYLGVPLRDGDGQPLGTLCAIDNEPRSWTAADLETLADLVSFLRTELELREANRRATEEVRVERSHRERSERVSDQRFRQVADSSTDTIFLWQGDPDPRLSYVNSAVEQLTGFPSQAFRDRPQLAFELVHPDDQAAFLQALTQPMERPLEYRTRHRSGSWRWTSLLATQIHGPDGRIEATQGVVRDIDERKRIAIALEQALRQEQHAADYLRRLNEMKSTFLTAVSHELRTPLTAITGFAELLSTRRDQLTVDQQAHYLDRLRHNARRLDVLLGDILDVDRLNRGILTPATRPVRIDELITRVLEAADITTHDVTLDAPAAEVVLDPAQMERVVENLVTNAARHTPAGTEVRIVVCNDDDGMLLFVEDTGPGIPDDIKDQVFEPFVHGTHAATAASPGTGLGLTLVRELVELHGGTCGIDDRPGGGARIWVRLPGRHLVRDTTRER